MTTTLSSNLLDEALGFPYDSKGGAVFSVGGGGRLIVVEDCVETSGAFVLQHLLKRSLSPHSSDVVIFLSFSQPFSHYERILRKMGCNLVVQREKKRLLFFDVQLLDRGKGKTIEDFLLVLYGKVHQAVEVCSTSEGLQNITIMIDDVSLMEIDVDGSSNLVLNFLRYCYSLVTQFGCSLVTLNHEDVYSTVNIPTLLLQLEYLADVVIKVKPLATGLASDVHGQLAVLHKGAGDISGKSRNKVSNFQFRIKDIGAEFFYSGSRTRISRCSLIRGIGDGGIVLGRISIEWLCIYWSRCTISKTIIIKTLFKNKIMGCKHGIKIVVPRTNTILTKMLYYTENGFAYQL